MSIPFDLSPSTSIAYFLMQSTLSLWYPHLHQHPGYVQSPSMSFPLETKPNFLILSTGLPKLFFLSLLQFCFHKAYSRLDE